MSCWSRIAVALGIVAVSLVASRIGLNATAPQTSADGAALASLYPPGPPRVPIGYDPAPRRPALRVERPRIDGPGFSVTIANDSAVRLEQLQYLAIVERLGWREPVTPVWSPTWEVSLAPGDRRVITSRWLDSGMINELMAAAERPAQIYLSPGYVRYADGTEWRAKVETTATTHRAALGLPF